MNTSILVFKQFSMILEEDGKTVHHLRFSSDNLEALSTELAKRVRLEIQEYLDGTRQSFNLPFELSGSAFEKDVWIAMTKIPYGHTWSYTELATRANHANAIRAVASACGRNPLPIVIPCHRVILSNGKIGNYTGPENMKETLLYLEKR